MSYNTNYSRKAHKILWVNQVDTERITKVLTAVMPSIFDTTLGEFLKLMDSHPTKLSKIAVRKKIAYI